MPVIHVLSPNVANQIAAGEVVERPASVVKELVENSIDAGSKGITIEIENGGLSLIRVSDNGCGIQHEQVRTAFVRHATSKINSAEDLYRIGSLGFRGEALPSIASVSSVRMDTMAEGEETGTRIEVEYGEIRDFREIGCPMGTTVEVRNLFSNVPARLKFIKSPRSEAAHITEYVSRMMMARPDIAFTLRNNGKTVYESFGDASLLSVLTILFGTGIRNHLAEVQYDDGYIRFSGYLADSDFSRPNRSSQIFFINGRYIRSGFLSAAVSDAYSTRLMIGRFPFHVLNVTVSASDVDVNVHPTKMEVRFSDEPRVFSALRKACEAALEGSGRKRAEPFPGQEEHPVPRYTYSIPAESKPVREELPGHPFRFGDVSGSDGNPAREPERGTESAQENRGVPEFDIAPRNREPSGEVSVRMEQPRLADAPFSIIGCMFDTYWIVQQDEDIFLIDQHAAHERKNYESLMAGKDAIVSQMLLVPAEMTLEPEAHRILKEHLDEILNLGYRIRFKEGLKIELDAVPQIRGEIPDESTLYDALDQIERLGSTNDRMMIRSILIQTSCKHAIKAGERIGREEIESLLSFYSKEGAPLTCPHGRPVMIRISRRELEKKFKRIV